MRLPAKEVDKAGAVTYRARVNGPKGEADVWLTWDSGSAGHAGGGELGEHLRVSAANWIDPENATCH